MCRLALSYACPSFLHTIDLDSSPSRYTSRAHVVYVRLVQQPNTLLGRALDAYVHLRVSESPRSQQLVRGVPRVVWSKRPEVNSLGG